jgi:hypothetical protein
MLKQKGNQETSEKKERGKAFYSARIRRLRHCVTVFAHSNSACSAAT